CSFSLPTRRALTVRLRPGACSRSADDQVDELSRDDDLLDALLAVELAPHGVRAPGELDEFLLGGVHRRLDAGAQLAVHLDDEGEGVALEQGRVRPRPRHLPYPSALDGLVDLGAEVRGEREQERAGG